MECCCRNCSFNEGTAVRGDRSYLVSKDSDMPYSEKFDGPGEETTKYGEK